MGRVMMRAHSFTGGFRFLSRFLRLPIGVFARCARYAWQMPDVRGLFAISSYLIEATTLGCRRLDVGVAMDAWSPYAPIIILFWCLLVIACKLMIESRGKDE